MQHSRLLCSDEFFTRQSRQCDCLHMRSGRPASLNRGDHFSASSSCAAGWGLRSSDGRSTASRYCRYVGPVKDHGRSNSRCRASGFDGLDSNQLHTALAKAVAAEKYEEAAEIKVQMQQRSGDVPEASWENLGLPQWLAERVVQLGYVLPTDIQRRSCSALQTRHSFVIQAETGSGKTLAFLLPLLSRLNYPPEIFPEDLLGPQMIVLVPTLELGAQIAMLVYKLFGGSVNSGIPGAAGNMYAYTGPRGLKVRGILNEEEVLMAQTIGYLKAVHVLVATPEHLTELLEDKQFPDLLNDLRAFAVDEVDLCFQDHVMPMQKILAALLKRQEEEKIWLALAGATVSNNVIEHAMAQGWLQDGSTPSNDSLQMPQSLVHRYLLAEEAQKGLSLCRQLRTDLKEHGEDAAPPRVIVFAENEQQAAKLASPLRNSLWGVHRLAVLLPQGEEPLQMLQAFRDNKATIMLATPAACRGLDLPAVTHVYNLACPDTASYIHRAGRVGRIGAETPGVITSIVTDEESIRLQQLADHLQFHLKEIGQPSTSGTDSKKQLEDIYNFLQAED